MIFGEPFGGLLPGPRGAVLSALLRTDTPLTGRQIHGLVSDKFSLSPVQEALRSLDQLGLIDTRTVGRAGLHSINEEHFAITHLRSLVDPIGVLRDIIEEMTDERVEAVIIFGSIARGESTGSSDVDLAVVAAEGWERGIELEDAVHARLGNDCEALVFTPEEFARLTQSDEPVVHDIRRDGIALFGAMPRIGEGE